MLCFLCPCYACFVSSCVVFLLFFFHIFASLFTCTCMCLWALICAIKHSSYPQSFVFHSCLCTWDPESLLGTLLDGRMSSVLQSNGLTNTKSKPTFVLLGHPILLACLITCLFSPLHAFFPRFLVSMSPFTCLITLLVRLVLSLLLCHLFHLSAGFVFSLFIAFTLGA